VPEDLLLRYGAVSEPVARAMAHGVRERFDSDIGIATTGISGPGGGSEEKPVGLVYLGLAWGTGIGRSGAGSSGGSPGSESEACENARVEGFVFSVDRARHRALTAQVALDWVRRLLLGIELVGPSLLRGGGAAAPNSQAGAGPAKLFTPRIGAVDPGRSQEPSGGN